MGFEKEENISLFGNGSLLIRFRMNNVVSEVVSLAISQTTRVYFASRSPIGYY